MAAAHLEDVLAHRRLDDVHDPARVLLLIQTLEHQVARGGALVADQVVVYLVGPDHEGVGGLADLALEGLPEVGDVVFAVFHSLLRAQPLHEALQVDVADAARALAAVDQGVVVLGAR